MASSTRALVFASGMLIAAPAAAQTDPPAPAPAPAAPAKADPPPPPSRPMGMQPGAQQSVPTARAPKRGAVHPGAVHPRFRGKRGRDAVDLSGLPVTNAATFQRLENGSTRISVEVNAKVDVAETRTQGKAVFRLRGAQVLDRVNRLPLLTEFFATPVDRAQLVQDGADVDLVIELREATELTHRVIETPRGIVLQVDFPRSASAEKQQGEQAPDNTSRDRAKRRVKTQSLGTDRKVEPSDTEN